MQEQPLAYHFTFGTYGTRLHGDSRGTVDRTMNRPNDPIIGRNEEWQQIERRLLQYPPLYLSRKERIVAEYEIVNVCSRGEWELHICAAQPDHIHVLLTALPERDSKAIRRWLKTWLSHAMNNNNKSRDLRSRSAVTDSGSGQRWWAKGGSIKWIWTQDYFNNVYEYITQQRIS